MFTFRVNSIVDTPRVSNYIGDRADLRYCLSALSYSLAVWTARRAASELPIAIVRAHASSRTVCFSSSVRRRPAALPWITDGLSVGWFRFSEVLNAIGNRLSVPSDQEVRRGCTNISSANSQGPKEGRVFDPRCGSEACSYNATDLS